jgi:hypothetical protein
MGLQNVFHYNILQGYSLYEHATSDSIKVPYGSDGQPLTITPPTGYTLTEHRPAGKYHNGAESSWQPNPDGKDTELQYRAGLDETVERHPTDGFGIPEFMNVEDDTQAKNYVVYDEGYLIENPDAVDQIDSAIKYSWTPDELSDKVVWLEANNESWRTGTDNVGQWRDITGDEALVSGGSLPSAYNDTIFEDLTFDGELVRKVQANGNVDNKKFFGRVNIGEEHSWWRYEIDVYIPDGTNLTSIGLTSQLAVGPDIFEVNGRSGWFTLTGVYPNPNFSDDNIFSLKVNGSCDYEDDSIFIYTRGLNIWIWEGNNFEQKIIASQPTYNSTDNQIEFNGVDEFLSCPVDSTNWQDLTYYEHFALLYVDQSNLATGILFQDEGSGNDRLGLFVDAAGLPKVYLDNDGIATGVAGDSALSVGWHLIWWKVENGNVDIEVDNVDQNASQFVGSVLNMRMIGDFTNKTDTDLATIGANILGTSTYFDMDIKLGLGTSTPTTAAQRTQIYDYCKRKFPECNLP